MLCYTAYCKAGRLQLAQALCCASDCLSFKQGCVRVHNALKSWLLTHPQILMRSKQLEFVCSNPTIFVTLGQT